MKNKISVFVLAFGAAVLFSSCLYIPKTYKTFLDTTAPADQNTMVTFDGNFTLKRWNDSIVYAYGTLTLPSGNNSFLFDARFTFSNQYSSTTYTMENIELRYLFEPGKKYSIKGKYKLLGLLKGYEFYVELYDSTKRPVLLREWKIGQT
jgi:hypothetical protein